MPREHCHKTDTFLPEPTAASHPCSAEKRKNKCPATPRRRDRRRTGRGPEDTLCMNAPPSPPPEKHGLPWAQDTPHGLRDLHGAARADGGSAPDRSVPARRPLSIRTLSCNRCPAGPRRQTTRSRVRQDTPPGRRKRQTVPPGKHRDILDERKERREPPRRRPQAVSGRSRGQSGQKRSLPPYPVGGRVRRRKQRGAGGMIFPAAFPNS